MAEAHEVSKQKLVNIGLNAWAVELLVESYFGMNATLRESVVKEGPLTFKFRSHKTPLLKVTLEEVGESDE